MASLSREQLEKWLRTVDVKVDNVLDIGGSQNPINKRVKSWEVKESLILDLPEPHEGSPKPDIECDLNKLDECTPEYKYPEGLRDWADISFCIEVSEYWYNPLQALKNINYFMKSGGVLYISFHFIYPVHNPKGLDYLRYTPNGAEKILEEAGFKVEEIINREGDGFGVIYDMNRMRGRKDYNQRIQGSLIKAIKK